MRTILLLTNLFFVLAVLGSTDPTRAVIPVKALSASPSPSLSVTLKAANDATILFKAEGSAEMTGPNSQEHPIPHLVLRRNGVLTPGFERTLLLSVKNLRVPAEGLYAHLSIETQHSDPDLGNKVTQKILVWDETRFIPADVSQPLTSAEFRMTFPEVFPVRGKSISTPTDYYRYQLTLLDRQENILQAVDEKQAFLMENQWRVPLPAVLEASPHAAPNELLVYYYDMIPFQTDVRDPETRIPRQAVGRYIQTELIPAMVAAFKTQTDVWRFPWYPEWSNYRRDEDSKTLSVALGDYATWFHGPAPTLGYAMISIRVDGSFKEYSNITDGIMSVFQHELFHNQQRNISLHFGGQGNIDGKEKAWELFTEGTAVLASLVGQPEVQFEPSSRPRSYLDRANAFIGSEGIFGGDLNRDYQEVPYHFAIYWRFLYESCGGLRNGMEDPATGMQVIRSVLENLYRGDMVDIAVSTDVTAALPRVVEAALQATPACAFHTYDESLTRFARAIYLLRLQDGRCAGSERLNACGFYDPQQLYPVPDAAHYLIQAGADPQITGSISTHYGIDLIELQIDPALAGKSLEITFANVSSPEDEFNIQLWKVNTLPGRSMAEKYSAQASEPASQQSQPQSRGVRFDNLTIDGFNTLGLIVTRTDRSKDAKGDGRYLIQVRVLS